MKPAPFAYRVPLTVDAALADLAEVADADGRVLAGGQTLVPAMALRLARPGHLVDINRVAGFDRLGVEGGVLCISACVRHESLLRRNVPGQLGVLLDRVRGHIAHYPIRLRGTFCGSLANADPASEWCLVAVTLGATMRLRSTRGQRELAADDFFLGHLATAIAPDEILVEARLLLLPTDARVGFHEFARRAGDFAQSMAVAVYSSADGRMTNVRIGVGAIDTRARRIGAAETLLEGKAPAIALFEEAGEAAAQQLIPDEPWGYRGRLAAASVVRALADAEAMRE